MKQINMKRLVSIFFLVFLLGIFSGTAIPADDAVPDLRGNWTSCSTLKADKTGFTPSASTFLMEIEDQSNNQFTGRLAINAQAPAWQKFRGTLDDQGRFLSILLTGNRVNIGYMISRNRLRLIYYGNPEDGMVAIHVLKRDRSHQRAALERKQ
jgi:hypothetical protein